MEKGLQKEYATAAANTQSMNQVDSNNLNIDNIWAIGNHLGAYYRFERSQWKSLMVRKRKRYILSRENIIMIKYIIHDT